MEYSLTTLSPKRKEDSPKSARSVGGDLAPVKVCCINCKAVYEYVKRRLPMAVHHLFENLPPPYDSLENYVEFLTDENNWVPSRVVVKLFENAKALLNDPDVAFKIGVESIAHQQLGYLQRFFIATFGNVSNVIKRINQINVKFTNTKTVSIIHDVPEHIIMRLHWNDNAVLSKDICSYNKGIFCAVPTLWKMEQGTIEEPLCHF